MRVYSSGGWGLACVWCHHIQERELRHFNSERWQLWGNVPGNIRGNRGCRLHGGEESAEPIQGEVVEAPRFRDPCDRAFKGRG